MREANPVDLFHERRDRRIVVLAVEVDVVLDDVGMLAPASAKTRASAANAFSACVAISLPITRPFSSSDIWPPTNTKSPALTACVAPGEAPPR